MAVVGVTTIVAAVEPVFQEKDEPPAALSVVEDPAQTDVVPLMLAVMLVVTVTVCTAVMEQLPLVTRTVYEVVAVGETTMNELVPPVFQE